MTDVSINFKLICENKNERRFRIRVYHANIQGQANISIISNPDLPDKYEEDMKWTQLDGEMNLNAYETRKEEGYCDSNVYSMIFRKLIIRLNRPADNTGYKYGAYFGGIEFADI